MIPAQLLTSKIFLYSGLCILPLGILSVLLGMTNFYKENFAFENIEFTFRRTNLFLMLLFTLQIFHVSTLLKKKNTEKVS
ncbi:hypothetical protein ASG01_05560 [Chryseobacterium sp. Leaf180]|nr:hypothetical protein ASG01_05560 [Chryseobacterium sp. Leaf180]